MFSSNQSKLAVLESKFTMYETLSREMLEKLENAVDKISESNQRIANILTKHDEKLEQNSKTDELILRMIEDVRHQNSNEHTQVISRIESVEKTVDDLLKFRWQAVTIGSLAVLIIGAAAAIIPPFIDNMMSAHYNGGTTSPLVK